LQKDGAEQEVTALQEKILKILSDTGGLEAQVLAERLGLKMSALEREIAALRHMEKVRGEMRGGKKFLRLW
jgi:hypothetical protein